MLHWLTVVSSFLTPDLANCRYRIQVVESNWPYFVGFGAPITLLMLLPQYYVVR